MSTEYIKEVLDEKYPGLTFKRLSKVKDEVGYTLRAFSSATKNVVVISMDDDGCEVAEICEVVTIPANPELKSAKRTWKPGGPLSGYYFAMGDFNSSMMGVAWFGVCEKSFWDKNNYMYDGEIEQPLFSHYGFEALMESTYQSSDESLDENGIRAKLVSLGATDRTGDKTFLSMSDD